MKKKLVAVTLPLIAGVALSGTGFGLWVFNETVDPFTVGASMQLEPAIAINSDCLQITEIKVVNANGKICFRCAAKPCLNLFPWR